MRSDGGLYSYPLQVGAIELVLKPDDYAGLKKEELPCHIDPITPKILEGFCGCNPC
jgi:hypothetical protein